MSLNPLYAELAGLQKETDIDHPFEEDPYAGIKSIGDPAYEYLNARGEGAYASADENAYALAKAGDSDYEYLKDQENVCSCVGGVRVDRCILQAYALAAGDPTYAMARGDGVGPTARCRPMSPSCRTMPWQWPADPQTTWLCRAERMYACDVELVMSHIGAGIRPRPE